MAVTSQAIPAAELASRAAEYPVWLTRNLAEIAYKQAAANFVSNPTGTLAAGDASAAGFDRRKLTQRHKHLLWKGNAAGTAWYAVIDLGTDLHWTDAVVLGPDHNLAGKNLTVEADSTTPAVPWVGATEIFASAAIVAGVNLRLHAATMYKARYWRVTLSGASFTPEATSLWLSKAIQFPVAPLLSSSTPNSYDGDAIEVETKGGIVYRYAKRGALMRREIAFNIPQHHEGTFYSDAGYGLDDAFKNANALNGGLANFWYVDQPTAAPNSAKLMRLAEPKYRPVLKRRGSSDNGLSSIAFELAEVGS